MSVVRVVQASPTEVAGVRVVVFSNVAAIMLGLVLGLYSHRLPEGMGQVLSLLAWLPVALIKGLASPLLFLAICNGLISDQPLSRGLRGMLAVCASNAFFAILIAMLLVNLLDPGQHLSALVTNLSAVDGGEAGTLAAVKGKSWVDAIKSFVPESIFSPFVTNNVPGILVLAVLFGVGVRRTGKTDNGWQEWFLTLRGTFEKGLLIICNILSIVLKLMPIAIMAAVAKAVAEHGLGVFKGLAWYVGICVLGMFLQIVIVYQSWVVRRAKRRLRDFWRNARLPVLYAFGVNSSLSALPSTLDALDRLGCSKTSARLGACVGTNFNNDGILLYEVAAVLMLAQAFGMEWSLSHQLGIAALCVLATFGVSGFPEAGIIALSLVLATAGLPVELIPLLLPVDWFIARLRSATNVLSDITVSLAIDGPA